MVAFESDDIGQRHCFLYALHAGFTKGAFSWHAAFDSTPQPHCPRVASVLASARDRKALPATSLPDSASCNPPPPKEPPRATVGRARAPRDTRTVNPSRPRSKRASPKCSEPHQKYSHPNSQQSRRFKTYQRRQYYDSFQQPKSGVNALEYPLSPKTAGPRSSDAPD